MIPAGLGGMNPAPVNAPQGATPASGVQPGQSNAIVIANKVIIFGPADGLFVYNGTPALGNPPVFWATNATVDPYGNPVTPTAGVAGSGTFRAGNTIINPAGTFIYAGTPAANNMLISSAPLAGTDQFGNDYLSSLTVYQFISPSLNRWAATTMFGSTRLMSMTPGSSQTGYVTINGGETFFNGQWIMEADTATTLLSNNIQASRQSSGLTGQIPLELANANFFSNANLAGTQAATSTYTIPALDCLVAGTTYEIETEFTGTFENQTLAMGHQLNGAAVGGTPQYPVLAAGFFAAGTTFTGWLKTTLRVISTGAGGTAIVFDKGGINQSTANLSSAAVGGTVLTGRQISIAYNTTVSNTLAIGSLWGGAAAGQTITYYGSVFRRRAQ